MATTSLNVTSHVGRDLLQSAQLFRYEHAVVWEYVANGLQYKDPATIPTVVVDVDVKAKRIRVRDNGRGMSMNDLRRYFQMHGENIDRKHGRPGRGYFGTGKSAAFGIANTLRITTVRNGLRSRVQLTRSDIDARPDGDTIPISVLEDEIKSSAANGTLVEIEGVFLKHLDIGSITRHIERHIAHWPNATVIVNNYQCEFTEPDINSEQEYRTIGTDSEAGLGDAKLVVKVAKAPLEEELRGIAILSEGVWYETTLAGCERKPFAEYLFGTFDVPALARDQSAIPAFDMSRSMRLNPRNDIVAEITRFAGVKLESIRRELEKQDRERRQSEERKRLQQQGSKIAELINEHFKSWRAKIKGTISKSGTGRDLLPASDTDNAAEATVVSGNELPGTTIASTAVGTGGGGSSGASPRDLPTIILDETSEEKIAEKSERANKHRSASGGFNVAFEKIGPNEKRAKYDRATRTIFINLEHPRVALELRGSSAQIAVDDPNFLRMAYEIAFTEYAIVLAQELGSEQYYIDAQDALVDVRQTLDDLSKAFASTWGRTGATQR